MDSIVLHVVEEIVARCELAKIELMAMIARKVWFQRNNIVHGGNFSHPNQVFYKDTIALDEFRRENERENVVQILP